MANQATYNSFLMIFDKWFYTGEGIAHLDQGEEWRFET